jgi:hypothetical protein
MMSLFNSFHIVKRNKRSLILLLVIILQPLHFSAGTSLRNKQVARLRVIYDQNQLRLPGSSIKLGIVAYLKNGDSVCTRGFLNGKVAWRNYNFEIEGGKFRNGNIRIGGGIDNTLEQQLIIKVASKHQPEISDYEIVNFNYSVKITLYHEGIIQKSPGQSFKIGVEARMDDGKIIRTGSSRSWWNTFDPYEVTVEGGQKINSRIYLHDSPDAFYQHQVKIKAWSRMNPSLVDSIFFLLDYRGESRLVVSGFDGFSGFAGIFGSSGSGGSDGEPGNHGQHGSDGARGPDLEVWVDLYYDTIISVNLLKIWVDNPGTGKSQFFLVNPDGGRLLVYSKGGDGGDGGSGGSGGSPGTGGTGNPNGSNGSSGNYGYCGRDGRDGPDGNVNYHKVDSEHFEY